MRNYGLFFSKGFYRERDDDRIRQCDSLAKIEYVEELLQATAFPAGDHLSWLTYPCDMSELRKKDTRKKTVAASEDVPNKKALLELQNKFNKDRQRKTAPQKITVTKEEKEKNESSILEECRVASFNMKVLYPGLYSSMSVDHGVYDTQEGDANNQTDFSTGFSFDYTTGLPYIPGSSVKGALRACFIDHADDVLSALRKATGNQNLSDECVSKIETVLFGNRIPENGRDTDDGIMGKAIFYDAFPISAENNHGSILADDYITPHPDPLLPPGPIIHTIKIKPDTVIRFCFSVPQSDLENAAHGVTAEHMIKVFGELLNLWGIGAKTNWGYGNLSLVRR